MISMNGIYVDWGTVHDIYIQLSTRNMHATGVVLSVVVCVYRVHLFSLFEFLKALNYLAVYTSVLCQVVHPFLILVMYPFGNLVISSCRFFCRSALIYTQTVSLMY